jgi:hypothetical protein
MAIDLRRTVAMVIAAAHPFLIAPSNPWGEASAGGEMVGERATVRKESAGRMNWPAAPTSDRERIP